MPLAARLGDPVGHDFDFEGFGAQLGASFGAALGAAAVSDVATRGSIVVTGIGFVAGGLVGGYLAGRAAVRARGLVISEARQAGAWLGEKLGRSIGAWLEEHLGSFKVTTGAIVVGDFTVLIESMPAARSCVDFAACSDHPTTIPPAIIKGSETVRIGRQPAARVGDTGACTFEILSGARTVYVGGASHLCACAALWKKYQDEAEAIIVPHDDDPRARNRAISAAYADLYLNNPDFVWAGLAAYASKQVGCAMDSATHAIDVGGKLVGAGTPAALVSPLSGLGLAGYGLGAAGAAAYTRDMLGKGNRDLFMDIYPIHRFYQEEGFERMKACAGARTPPLEPEAIAGFEALTRGDRRESLRQIAFHEQINVLQPLIYDDYLLRRILVANETGAPLTSPAKLVLGSGCEDGPTTHFSRGWFNSGSQGDVPELYDASERMNWILQDATPLYEEVLGTEKHLEDLEQIKDQAPP